MTPHLGGEELGARDGESRAPRASPPADADVAAAAAAAAAASSSHHHIIHTAPNICFGISYFRPRQQRGGSGGVTTTKYTAGGGRVAGPGGHPWLARPKAADGGAQLGDGERHRFVVGTLCFFEKHKSCDRRTWSRILYARIHI
jgi:hypothetical protein